MLKILITIIMTFQFNHSYAANKIHRYQDEIIKQCPKVDLSKLLLKKSLIELVKGEECNGIFVSRIMDSCEELTCKKILEIFWEVDRVRPGSVIGEGK